MLLVQKYHMVVFGTVTLFSSAVLQKHNEQTTPEPVDLRHGVPGEFREEYIVAKQ